MAENITVKLFTLIVVSTLRIILRQKTNAVERTKMQYKCILNSENINKHHEYNTSVNCIKSLIGFENLVAFTRKLCCLKRAIEYVFAFNHGNIFFQGK